MRLRLVHPDFGFAMLKRSVADSIIAALAKNLKQTRSGLLKRRLLF
jgi:hypothetical protein